MQSFIDILMVILCIAGIVISISIAVLFSIQEGFCTAIIFGAWLFVLDTIIEYTRKKK